MICCLELSFIQIQGFNNCATDTTLLLSCSITCKSFFLGGLVDALLLLLSLNLAVLLLVGGLALGSNDLVALVVHLETVLGGLVDGAPHVADDLGDLGDLGGGVLGLDAVIHFLAVEEKGGEGPFRSWRLS